MKSNILILIFFVIQVSVLCENISRDLQNTCESISPKIIIDCSNASSPSNSCCFVKIDGVTTCKYYGSKIMSTFTKIDGSTWHCDNPKGSACGPVTPSTTLECAGYGAKTNACCFYTTGAKKGCMWWGSGFTGSTVYNDLNVSCNTNFIKPYVAVFMLMLIFLI